MIQIAVKTALLVASSLVVGRAFAMLPGDPEETARDLPRLTIVLSVDQFRADYLDRFGPFFGTGGFKRIYRDGVRCKDSAYRQARTETGPGHSVIGTGAYPHRSGIVGNSWRDRKSLKNVYCVSGSGGPSPESLLVPTLADLWKERFGERARILSLAFKDRAAILMAGRGADGVFWFDGLHGRFRSSPWYDRRPASPARTAAKAWISALAKGGTGGRLIDSWLGQTWKALPCPSKDPVQRKLWDSLPPDDRKGETPRNGWKPLFPKRFSSIRGPRYYAQVKESPYGNEFLFHCLLAAIDSKTLLLGQRRNAVDLVFISLSSLDYVGHAHGPWSHEVRDVLLRLDAQLAAFFRALDKRIGRGRWTLALSGDHGVGSTMARSRRLGRDAGVVSQYRPGKGEGLVRARLGDFLLQSFEGRFRKGFLETSTEGLGRGLVDGLCLLHDGDVYMRPDLEQASGIPPADLLGALEKFFLKEPYVQATFRRRDLREPKGRVAGMVARSFHPDRSGDLMITLKSNWLWRWAATGASHGTHHSYDRMVPLLFLGQGIVRGETVDTAGIEDLVPTLAQIMGIARIESFEGHALNQALLAAPVGESDSGPEPGRSSRKGIR